jgi:hypothetical protein
MSSSRFVIGEATVGTALPDYANEQKASFTIRCIIHDFENLKHQREESFTLLP